MSGCKSGSHYQNAEAMAATVTERHWVIGDIVGMLKAWEATQVCWSSWEEGHGMVQPENIDSGYPNFQLDTRSCGSRRDLDYLSRCNVTVAASPYAVAHAAPATQ